jgi:hypothetical protein
MKTLVNRVIYFIVFENEVNKCIIVMKQENVKNTD